MNDDAADPNPNRLPFTRDEYLSVVSKVVTGQEAEQLAARMYEPHPDLIGITLMDGDYLLMAAVSADIADRLSSMWPRLSEAISWARANPDVVIAGWRSAYRRTID